MQLKTSLRYLEDRWDDQVARGLDQPELLRYRSNLLGSDLRITNFGGGNTSSKIQQTDPLSGKQEEVLWIKGSGGDLGSIKLTGLAALYSEKLHGLEHKYRGAEFEDEMVEMYPLCAFGKSTVAASIDSPLHGFLPFPHIDHLHPDWGIALAASANGREKMEEFNRLLREHDLHHRSARTICGRPRRQKKRGVVRRPAIPASGQSARSRARHFSFPAGKSLRRPTLDWQLQRSAGSPALRKFSGRRTVGTSGHQLSRPLYPHQSPAFVCSLAAGRECAGTTRTNRILAEEVPQGIRGILQLVRAT